MIEELMKELAAALPEMTSATWPQHTIRDVALHLYHDGSWLAMAGGHPAVDLGEWCGDFYARGETAEAALAACLENIKHNRSHLTS